MDKKYRFGRNQLIILMSLILLAPALRVFPSASAAAAGRASWLTAPAALPLLLLFFIFICDYMNRCGDGEGLAELLLRSGGPVFGRFILTVSALWLLLYGGFSLRAGANRLITTIYPTASAEFFSVSMGLMGLAGALGSSRALARTAKLAAPAVFGVLLLVLIFAFFSVDRANLSAVTVNDIPNIARGSLSAVDVVAGVTVFCCFTESAAIKKPGRFRVMAIWAAVMLALLFLISTAIIGNFGAELSAKLTRPFFSMARSLVLFDEVERVEALVVSLWTFPDFFIFSAVLGGAQKCLRLLFGLPAEYAGERFFDLSHGRFIIWLSCGVSILCSVLLWQSPDTLRQWSLEIIPALNMSYAFALLPLVYIIGRTAKKI